MATAGTENSLCACWRFRRVLGFSALILLAAGAVAGWAIGIHRLRVMAWDARIRLGGPWTNPKISIFTRNTRIRAYPGPAMAVQSFKGLQGVVTVHSKIIYQNTPGLLPVVGSPQLKASAVPKPARLGTGDIGAAPSRAPSPGDIYLCGPWTLLPALVVGLQHPSRLTIQIQSTSRDVQVHFEVGLTVDGKSSGPNAEKWSKIVHSPLLHPQVETINDVTITTTQNVSPCIFGVEYAPRLSASYMWQLAPIRRAAKAWSSRRVCPPHVNFAAGLTTPSACFVYPDANTGANLASPASLIDPVLRLHVSIPKIGATALYSRAMSLIRQGAREGELATFLAGPYGGLLGGAKFQRAAAYLRAADEKIPQRQAAGLAQDAAMRIRAARLWLNIFRTGVLRGKRKAFAALAAATPHDPRILTMLATLQLSRACNYKMKTGYSRALATVAQALKHNPNYADAWWLKGQIEAFMGHKKKVIADDRQFLANSASIDPFVYLDDMTLIRNRIAATKQFLAAALSGSEQPNRFLKPVVILSR